MCILCTELWTEDHWAEEGVDQPSSPFGAVSLERHADRRGQRLRDRWRRVQVANMLLADAGLRLQDWEGASYLLRDQKGNSLVIPGLGKLWAAVEQMLGRPLDPLAPAFVRRALERHASESQ